MVTEEIMPVACCPLPVACCPLPLRGKRVLSLIPDFQKGSIPDFQKGSIPYPLSLIFKRVVSLIRDNIVCMRKTKDTRIHKGCEGKRAFLSAIISLVIPLEG